MNYNTVGAFGSSVSETTSNIDKLAMEWIIFTNAHVNHVVYQPSRGAIMMGMYDHVSCIEEFQHYDENAPTLSEYLRGAGFLTGVIRKVDHSLPKFEVELYKFDLIKRGLTENNELGFGRDPEKYYEISKLLFLKAKEKDSPFFSWPIHMILADLLPEVMMRKKEIAQYYNSVRRCDDTIGNILQALKESGLEKKISNVSC